MADRTAPRARFDDLVGGHAMAFEQVERVLVARNRDEVVGVLAEVERLTAGGCWAFGFVAYEAASALDPGLAVHEPVEGLPLIWFAISTGPRTVPPLRPGRDGDPVRRSADRWSLEWDTEAYERAVRRVHAAIAAGETYQCNLTTRLVTPTGGDPALRYRDLALGQRSAYNAHLDTGRFTVASASPELFFEIAGDRILMRPMKGTSPRGRTEAEDAEAVARLRGSDKERAENVMIVDLVRNDLARVAVAGSVTVPRLLHAERYETVHQLTSDVTARLRPNAGLVDVFRALFPCGSVTGAPKARTMELIRELEVGPRGVYCGAIGFLAPPGAPVRARFSVAIRTVLVDRERGIATYGTGGGVTWDSRAADEFAELLAKARVLDVRPQDFHLLETFRHEAGRGARSLDAHLARAARSARYFGFRLDVDRVRAAVTRRLAKVGDQRVRLRLFRDGGFAIELSELPAPAGRPLRLELDDDPVDSRTCWPHHKTSLREPYTTRLARHPDADDVLLINDRGEVTESCTASLAVLLDGFWWTPPLSSGCLPGVERGRLVAAGRLRERTLHPEDLRRADAVALVNSLRGWRAAVLAPAEAVLGGPL